MKKIVIKILVINILLILVAMIGIEAYTYKKTYEETKADIAKFNKAYEKSGDPFRFKIDYEYPKAFNYEEYKLHLRPVNYKKSNKRPVLFFGCSFTEGLGLKNEQTLAYKISELSNRTTYNRGKSSTGPQFMYYQLNDKNFKKEVPDAEYIIYTFIWAHFERLYNYRTCRFIKYLNLRYKIVNNHLVEVDTIFPPIYSLYTVKNIQYDIEKRKTIQEEKDNKMFNLMMEECYKLAQEKYPHSKFVILEYPDWTKKKLPISEIKRLEKMGFVVVNAENLVGHSLSDNKYILEDKLHPSESAWSEVAPKLVKKLEL